MQKRFLITILSLAASLSLFVGCGKSEDADTSVAVTNSTDWAQEDSGATEDGTESENNSIAPEEDDSSESIPEVSPETTVDEQTTASHKTDEDASQATEDSFEATEETNTTAPTGHSDGNGSSAPSVPADNGVTNPGAVSADDYRHDLDEFDKLNNPELLEIVDENDLDAMLTYLYILIDSLSLKTPEGSAIKTDFMDLLQLMEDMETIDTMDEDAFNALFEQVLTLESTIEMHLNAFADAARAAGLSEDELDMLGLY